jgi:hypothetical protein
MIACICLPHIQRLAASSTSGVQIVKRYVFCSQHLPASPAYIEAWSFTTSTIPGNTCAKDIQDRYRSRERTASQQTSVVAVRMTRMRREVLEQRLSDEGYDMSGA